MKATPPLLALLGLLCALPPAAAGKSSPSTVAVRTVTAKEGTLPRTVTAYGRIKGDPNRVTTLSADHPVVVATLAASRGKRVAKGEHLAALRTAPGARADYTRAAARVKFALRALHRQRKLLKQHLATRADVSGARGRLAQARADLEAQKALGNDRKQAPLRAPFDAVVTDVAVSAGDHLGSGAKLLTLTPAHSLIADLGMEADRARGLAPHAPVVLRPVFGGDPVVHTRVHRIQGGVSPRTDLVDARVLLRGRQAEGFLPGQAVRGTITTGRPHGIRLPRSAVLRDKNGAYLFVVRGHQAHRVAVHVQVRIPDRVLVTGDVHADEAVVVEGNYELHDGAAVRGGA